MDPQSREKLRRDVRAAVHRACWLRLDGDEAGAETVMACELPAACSSAPDPSVSEVDLRAWIADDEADFERAVLISDLVARRLHQTSVPRSRPVFSPLSDAQPEPAPAPPRPAPAAAPAIADLLDGMLEQDRRARAKAS